MTDVFAELHNYADSITATAIFFLILTTIAVLLKFVVRSFTKLHFGPDDWTLVLALLSFYAGMGLELKAVYTGKAATGVTDPKYTEYLKFLYIYAPLYFTTVLFTNMSILFLYRRIFSTSKFRKVSLYVIGAHILWFIPGLLVEIFACTPISAGWDITTPGSCIQYSTFLMTFMVMELVLDVVLLTLPILEVKKLQLTVQRKVGVIGVFLLGGLSIITGIVRLVETYDTSLLPNIDPILDALWLNVHLATAILCACLPTYKPLITFLGTKLSSISSSFTLRFSGSQSNTPNNIYSDDGSRIDTKYREIGVSVTELTPIVDLPRKPASAFVA